MGNHSSASISIQILYINARYISKHKFTKDSMGKWDQHALGLALLKGKELESATLHEVVSQASQQQCPSLVEETPMTI
jgi:hypothetical protein